MALAWHVVMMGSLFWGYLNSLFDNTDLHLQGVDFFSIYEAGHRALENRSVYAESSGASVVAAASPCEAYRAAASAGDPEAFQRLLSCTFASPPGSQETPDAPVTPYHAWYRYLPFTAYTVALPWNALSPWDAYWGWVALNELLLVINAYLTWRVAGRGTWGVLAAAAWFVFTPFYVEMYMGQFSFLMATALLWTGIGLARGRERIAGPSWVASLLLKSNSGVLSPQFLRLRWHWSLGAAVVLVGLNLVYFAFRPEDFEWFYKSNISSVLEDPGSRIAAYNPGDLGAVAFLRNTFLTTDAEATNSPVVYQGTFAAVVLALSLAATFLARTHDGLGVFAIWISAFFLTYAIWEHHYVMYLPVLALLVALRPAARPWALFAFVLVALPTPYWLLENIWNTGPLPRTLISHQDVWPAWGVILYHASKPLPVLVLWAYLVASELRTGLHPWVARLVRAAAPQKLQP